ncbi:MAG TPA: hypothetical protein VME46_09155 [Acidimicrobiales bacterium]|nr:hypothetical protein [Acidimicrobiales bacterium]
MAMRPVARTEAYQHLLVLAIAALLIILPFPLVSLWKLQYSLVGLGIFFVVLDLGVFVALRRPRA